MWNIKHQHDATANHFSHLTVEREFFWCHF